MEQTPKVSEAEIKSLIANFEEIDMDTDLFLEEHKTTLKSLETIDKMIIHDISSKKIIKAFQTLKKVFRIHQKPAQDLVRNSGLIENLLKQPLKDVAISVTRNIFSLLVNFVTGNPENQSYTFKLLTEHKVLIDAALTDNEATYYLLIFLYNSICTQSELYKEFLTSNCLISLYETIFNVSHSDDEEKQFVTEVHEWSARLLILIITQGNGFSDLFVKFGSQSTALITIQLAEGKIITGVSSLQKNLIKYIAEIVEEMSEKVAEQSKDLDKITRSLDMMKFISQDIFKGLVQTYREQFIMEELLRLLHDVKPNVEGQEDKPQNLLITTHENILDTLEALLQLFGDLTALTADEQYLAQSPDSTQSNDLTQYLNDNGLLDTSLLLYQTLKQALDTMIEVKLYHQPSAANANKNAKNPFAGFYSKLAKLISNLTYLQPKHVDRVFVETNPQYLGLILSHTRMDEHNPTLREWSLMVIRNLCQVSEGVRKMLGELKKVDVQDESLEKLGIKEEYDRQNKNNKQPFLKDEDRPKVMGPPLISKSSTAKLFKEYAICDLTQYKTGNIGLRWCLERDIFSGKGKTICGNKHCQVADQSLHSYEVMMSYTEADEATQEPQMKQAMVKVNLCSECAVKLNYKKYKDKMKKRQKKEDKKRKKKEKKRERSSSSESS